MVFQPELETMPRAELERLQRERLRARFGVELEALPEQPFTTKADLRDAYPFGMLRVPRDECIRIHASSGTRGKPTIVGAGGGPQTMRWIARHAAGWMTTPTEAGIGDKVKQLQREWEAAGREGKPDIRVLVSRRPTPEYRSKWSVADELIWGVPDAEPDAVRAHLDKLAALLSLS